MHKFIAVLPKILNSSISIFIFLFIYLVIFGLIRMVWPALQPSADVQLVLGNYTNVTSALGAAIVAGASTASHRAAKQMRKRHDELQKSVDLLHEKIDRL